MCYKRKQTTMAYATKIAVILVMVCAALVLQPVAAQQGYRFNFGGGRWLVPDVRMLCLRFVTCSRMSCHMARLPHLGMPYGNAAGRRPPALSLLRHRSACAVAGLGSGIYNSARFYQQNGISQGQYRQDLSNALSSSGASASAAASGDLLP